MKIYPHNDKAGKRAVLNTRILLKCQAACETAREMKHEFPHDQDVETMVQLADIALRQAKLVASRHMEGVVA